MRNLLLVLALISMLSVEAATISIGPGDSIQTAINSASNGDIVSLAAGIYKESFQTNGKAITIRGSGRDTVLKGSKFKAAITINANEGQDTIVENITFKKGLRAGAILIDQAAPTIRQCWFYANRAIGAASAINIFGTNDSNQSPIITNNVFYKNKTRSVKPGNIAHAVFVNDSSPTINNNNFISNDRAGVYVKGLSAPLITSNIFAYQGRGKGKERKKINNFGERELRGRAVFIENLQGGANVQISYNLSFGHRTADVYIQGEDFSFTTLDENPVSFVTTNNNLVADAQFANVRLSKSGNNIRRLRDVSLSSSSPAINAGNPDASFNDTDASRNDIGATGGSTPFSFSALQ